MTEKLPAGSSPLTRQQIVDMYFMEHRAKIIDIAAYLDRLDRASDCDSAADDFRDAAFRKALAILLDNQPHRAKRVLLQLSDHTDSIPQSADGMKGAAGAHPANAQDGGAA